MPITLRNKATEALIRKLGKPRGEGPSATIARLAREAAEREEVAADIERRLRRETLRHVIATLPKLSSEEKASVRDEAGALYDVDGLPR